MAPEDLADRVDGDRLERPAGSGRRGRPEQGVVDGLLGRLDAAWKSGETASVGSMRRGTGRVSPGRVLSSGDVVKAMA